MGRLIYGVVICIYCTWPYSQAAEPEDSPGASPSAEPGSGEMSGGNFWDSVPSPPPELDTNPHNIKDSEMVWNRRESFAKLPMYGYGRTHNMSDVDAKVARLQRKVARLQRRKRRWEEYVVDSRDAYMDSLVLAVAVPMIKKSEARVPDPRSYVQRLGLDKEALKQDMLALRGSGTPDHNDNSLWEAKEEDFDNYADQAKYETKLYIAEAATDLKKEKPKKADMGIFKSNCASDDLNCQLKEYLKNGVDRKRDELQSLVEGQSTAQAEAQVKILERGVKDIVMKFNYTKQPDLERLAPRSSDTLLNKVIHALKLQQLVQATMKTKQINKDGSILERMHNLPKPMTRAQQSAISHDVADSFEEAFASSTTSKASKHITDSVASAFDSVTVKCD